MKQPTEAHIGIIKELEITEERDMEIRDTVGQVMSKAVLLDNTIATAIRLLSERGDLTDLEKTYAAYQFGMVMEKRG